MTNDEKRRKELGDFLRNKRKSLCIDEFGILNASARRTTGLRRDEVASRAGISAEWYTLIEQGRARGVSQPVLESIARAMRLNQIELRTLFQLANQGTLSSPPPLAEAKTTPALRTILDGLGSYPAYVTDPRFDLVAYNRSAHLLLHVDLDSLPPSERNLAWLMFMHLPWRQIIVDWEQHARIVAGTLRANSLQYFPDPTFDQLIKDLSKKSPEFRKMWNRYDVKEGPEKYKEVNHPVVGYMRLEQSIFLIPHHVMLTLVVDTPADIDSSRKLQELSRISRPKRRRT